MHGTDLGPLHICNSCAAGSSCGTPKVGAASTLSTLPAFESLSANCLASIEDVPTLMQLDMPRLVDIHGSPPVSEERERMGEGMGLGGVHGGEVLIGL